jgi:uncharacterized membrane protein
MTNLIVISFKDEAKAFEAAHKLSELESFGDISIYEKVIVKKDAGGSVTQLQSDTSDGLRLGTGLAVGTMIGAIGGPVGLVIGMLSGSIIGAIAETQYTDLSDDFVSKVDGHLQSGSVAILAEVSEDNPDFINTAMAPFDATIFRADVDDYYDDYQDEQVEEFDNDIATQRANFKAAAAKDKSSIQKKIDELKAKRKQRIAELKAKHNERKQARLEKRIHNTEEKTDELQEQLKEVKDAE